MNSSNSSSTGDGPDKAADLLVGTVLLVCTLLGVPANLASCYYFSSRAARNANTLFFNRVYTVISFVDCLICVLQLPVVQVLFGGASPESGAYTRPTSNSSSLLFNNGAFCSFWSVLWNTLSVQSVVLVAVLSLSRLCLLMYPTKQLSPASAWLVPALSGALIACVLCTAPILLGYTVAVYFSEYGVCFMMGDSGEFWNSTSSLSMKILSNTTIPSNLLKQEAILNFAYTVLITFLAVLITVAFALSMGYLNKALKRSESTNSSSKQTKQASLTVVLVTSIYLVCNVPTLLYYLQLIYNQVNAGFLGSDKITYEQYISSYEAGPGMFNYYLSLVGLNLPIVLNSTLNPAVYLWRMQPFRRFVLRQSEVTSSKAVTSRDTPAQEVPKRRVRFAKKKPSVKKYEVSIGEQSI